MDAIDTHAYVYACAYVCERERVCVCVSSIPLAIGNKPYQHDQIVLGVTDRPTDRPTNRPMAQV